jgi:hypothetical protein
MYNIIVLLFALFPHDALTYQQYRSNPTALSFIWFVVITFVGNTYDTYHTLKMLRMTSVEQSNNGQ